MEQSYGRVLRRRKLGGELRRCREAAGLSVRSLAPLANLRAGTISKIENGRQAILARNVRLILQACGTAESEIQALMEVAEQQERESWWLPYSDSVPSWFRDYVDLESDAESICTYSGELIDGMLQTAGYAEAVARLTRPDRTPEQHQRAVGLRQARQHRLDRADARLHVVLSEAAVLRAFGGAEVMREQMEHLASLAERDTITIQILSFDAGGHPAAKGPFTILQFPDGLADVDCVYLENENGAVWQDDSDDLRRYEEVFARTSEMALSPVDTIGLIDKMWK